MWFGHQSSVSRSWPLLHLLPYFKSLQVTDLIQSTIEATPGIEIQGKRLPQSRIASISHFITQLQRSKSRLSPVFPLSVHGVVPNPYQIEPLRKFGFLIACEIMTR